MAYSIYSTAGSTVVLRVSCRQHDDGETDSQESEEADVAIGWNDGLAIGAGACWAGSYHHAEYHEYCGGHLNGLFLKLDSLIVVERDFAWHCMFLLGSYLVCCT